MTSGQENTENATEAKVIGISRDGAYGEFSQFFLMTQMLHSSRVMKVSEERNIENG